MDTIYVVNEVLEKYAEHTEPLYMTFIDNKKAVDSALAAAALEALKDQRIEETYIRLLEDIYMGLTGGITLPKQSDNFPIRKRVRQGDTIPPKVLTACLEGIFRKLDWENIDLRINGEYSSHFRFANGIVYLTENAEHMQTKHEEH